MNKVRWAGQVKRRENEEIIKRNIPVKLEGKRKKGRLRMRWMDGVEDLRNLGMVNWKNKDTRTGWLEKVFRAGQDAQRAVVPIKIIIVIIIIIKLFIIYLPSQQPQGQLQTQHSIIIIIITIMLQFSSEFG
jgi:hypothetical protein